MYENGSTLPVPYQDRTTEHMPASATTVSTTEIFILLLLFSRFSRGFARTFVDGGQSSHKPTHTGGYWTTSGLFPVVDDYRVISDNVFIKT